MSTAEAIDAKALRAAFDDGGELAVIDVREEGVFGQRHILRCNNIPLSILELSIRDQVPRLGTRIVLVDAAEGLAQRAAATLSAMGYDDLSILTGGIDGWDAAGFELFSGMNVPSKVFGEYVEHHCGTPNISAEELKGKIDSGENLVILDSRPMDEYHRMNIPGGIDSPGAELAYHVRDLAPDPDTLVVVNCAGRTRSIIGAQSLINAGTPNKVMALTNGTMGRHLAGFELEHGASRKYDSVSDSALDWSQAAAAQVAEKYGVTKIDVATLSAWQGETDDRTLYLFDVRSPEEYEAGHVAGARHAAGGQLVQATDKYVATNNARVVLIDDTGVRATMTAHWLIQMGWTDVHVLDGGLESLPLVTGAETSDVPEVDAASVATVGPAALPDGAVVIDVADSLAYRDGHIAGAWWAIRARFEDALTRLPAAEAYVVTSDDGRLARLAAQDLAALTDAAVYALEGGTAAWRAAGKAIEEGYTNLAADREDIFYKPYDREGTVEDAMNQYLDWEIELINQIKRDGTLIFPEFAP
ncbi:MAG: rhodanese-like domain-containing protein [Rhodospirillaceae bacterium]|nr:rhodanese-like domain-containing protein [Rhodospirillaceae bacterium]